MSIDPPVKSLSCSGELILGWSLFSKVAEFRDSQFHFIKKFLIRGAGITLKIVIAGRERKRTHCQAAKSGIKLIRDHFDTAGRANIGTGAAADAHG
jgi:hypothetical protein